MSRLIRFLTSLLTYDRPQVVLGVDQFDARYIGLLVDHGDETDRYLCAPISASRFEQLMGGEVDLRSIYEDPEEASFFLVEWEEGLAEEWTELVAVEEPADGWLPDPHLLFSDFLPAAEEDDDLIRTEAASRNRAIVHLALGRHDALPIPRVDALELSGALSAFQQLVKQAFRRSLRSVGQKAKEYYADPDHHELEVFAFSPGSFRVHMQTKSLPDLFGEASVDRAFELVDAMTRAITSPAESLEVVRQNRGHLASAYTTFLAFVRDSDDPVHYSWAVPGGDVTHRRLTPDQAALVLEILSQEKELGSEWVDLTGVFTKVNTKTGSWTLESEGGKEHHGSLHEEADDILSGVVVKEVPYKLVCEEILVETLGSRRHKNKLLLRHLETV